jgi:8-oxo-dGTP pyrophosphatase MutT (NUDIX family)
MNINELFILMENDWDHAKALQNTGYWGAQGAGSIPLARSTKRFLIAHRSHSVEQPGTWGTWGGAIDADEDPKAAAARELAEEAGHVGHLDMVPLYVFQDKSFRYSNFLAVVDEEFNPELNWETQGYRWCEFGKWPKPLHFGLRNLLNDAASIRTIQQVLQRLGDVAGNQPLPD